MSIPRRWTVAAILAASIWAPANLTAQDGGRSRLSVTVQSFSFSATVSGAPPPAQAFTVSAASPTAFRVSSWVRDGGTNWLSVSPAGSLTTNQTIAVSVASGSLAAGTHSGSIRVSTGEDSYTNIPVTLVVTAAASPPITVSPASLSFTATAGGAAPAAQSLAVTAASTVGFSVSSAASWLTIAPSGNLNTNTNLAITASPAGLAPGSYSGAVSLVSNGVTTTVPVSFTVAPPPITVSPASLSFTATAGGAAPAAQSLAVTASYSVSFSVSSAASWLTIAPSTNLNTNTNLAVTANPAGLAPGSYSGAVSLVSNGVTTTVPVTFTVAPPPITVSPASLSFNATAGGAAPAAQSLAVTAASSVGFSVSSAASWLTIAPSGNLNTNTNLAVTANPAGLAPGSYTSTVTLVSNGVTTTVPVSFTVAPPPITVSPASLSFNATAGGAAPAAQSLAVTASYSVGFSVSNAASWLTIAPSGNSNTDATLTVTATPGSLAAGTYAASISLLSNGVTTTVPVSLVVASPPLTVSATSLTFNGTAGGSNPRSQTLSVTAASSVAFTASAAGVYGSTTWLSISPSGNLTTNAALTVQASAGSLAAGTYSGAITLVSAGVTTTVPVSLVVANAVPPPTGSSYKLVGWNDLGMHCFDGKDYSVFGVLPPFNTIHVHLIDNSGLLVKSPTGVTVTYQAINDPLMNLLNTSSTGKTNFWQFAAALGFGALAPDVGLKGYAMPGAGNTPQAMTFSTTDNTWLAVGIPITPFGDAATTPYPVNYFPMMRLTAKNASGAVLGTTDIVLPTSDEMTCLTCHASNSVSAAAMPAAGWVNNSDMAKDVKLNILRKHDDRFQASAVFQNAAAANGYSTAGLYANYPNRPILCAACHGSNALGLPGYPGVPPLTQSMHSLHATVTDPSTGATLDSGVTRASCYHCHPGPKTQCLRGAMATLTTSTGANQIECQSCHGNLSNQAVPGRQGWLEEPSCQMCHSGTAVANNGSIAYTSVFSTGTTQRVAVDQTFATNANTPAAGLSLYRFSSGHGGLQCEACHNSTHAEYATPIANDNVQSNSLQGHVGMLAECTACHATTPNTTNGGPHGLHPLGSTWVSRHPDLVHSTGATQCQVCHGTDYRGTILSKTKAARTLAGRSFPAGTVIGCYSCHNGPSGG